MRPVYDVTALEEQTLLNPDLELKWSHLVRQYIKEEAFPGCVIYVSKEGRVLFHRPFGNYTYDPGSQSVVLDTMYDLASVTKITTTVPMVMKLWEEKKVSLDMKVIDFFPDFKDGAKPDITLQNLITHMSGLPSWVAFYKERSSVQEVIQAICVTPLKYPTGSRTEYSDLNMILMGEIVHKIYGAPLDVAVHREIHRPLGMNDTMYRPGPELRQRIAPTENDPWRGRLLQGEVHDENAYAMGGVSGHAGLFSTTGNLSLYGQCILNRGILNGVRIFNEETIEFFAQRPSSLIPGPYALGWWRNPSGSGDEKTLFSPGTIGHTGYTGTSIWLDRKRQTQIIVLSNRVYPSRRHVKIGEFRRKFENLVISSLFPSER